MGPKRTWAKNVRKPSCSAAAEGKESQRGGTRVTRIERSYGFGGVKVSPTVTLLKYGAVA